MTNSFKISIPQYKESNLDITFDIGDTIFIVGANGTGKSSLMQKAFVQNKDKSLWISAHRQTWFQPNAMMISPSQRQQTEVNIKQEALQPAARWMDSYSAPRASMAIFDLVNSENVRARKIAGAVDRKDMSSATTLSDTESPITVINELLRLSNIPIEISVDEQSNVMARKSGSKTYSVAELSDGERNVLIIASNILTAKRGTLFLIDEPERHLHRSIISPLLTLLFSRRSDCVFVVSTHDVSLAVDNADAKILLLRSCTCRSPGEFSWDADLVDANSGIDDEIKKDIFGSRRHIVFVEGNEHSLDKPLYSLLLDGVSVISKSSCRDVEQAVVGVNSACDLHWVRAWGVIDNDGREKKEIKELKEKGVYALTVYSVESIYYHNSIKSKIAGLQAKISGDDASELLESAKRKAISAIRSNIDHLANRAAEKNVRKLYFSQIPNKKDISSCVTPIEIKIDIESIKIKEKEHLNDMLDSGSIEEIFSHYPVRETPALDAIAKCLKFQGRKEYEKAVLKLLKDDSQALESVKSLFGNLMAEVAASSPSSLQS